MRRFSVSAFLLPILVLCCTASYGSVVARYELDGDAVEFSGGGPDGIVVDATPTVDRWGNQDAALYFNNYSRIEFSSPIINAGPMTMCGWIQTSDSYGYVVANGGETAHSYGIYALVDGGEFEVGVKSASVDTNFVQARGVVGSGWTFVCMTWDGEFRNSSLKLYIDGAYIASNIPRPWNATSAQPNDMVFGAPSSSTSFAFGGAMDDFRFFNRVLSHDEVYGIYGEAYSEVSGTAASAVSGLPIMGADVGFYPQQFVDPVETNELGFWSTRVPAGSGYRLEIGAPGYQAIVRDQVTFSADVAYHYDDELSPIHYDAVRFTSLVSGGQLAIPQYSDGMMWVLVEGQIGGSWHPVGHSSVLASDENGDVYEGAAGSIEYATLGERVSVPLEGVVQLRVPWSSIGEGGIGDSEVVTITHYNGLALPHAQQFEFVCVIDPLEYAKNWGYRAYVQAGGGARLGLLKAGGFAGGGTGSVIKIETSTDRSDNEWSDFRILRKHDAFAGLEAGVSAPMTLSGAVGGEFGAGAELRISAPSGQEYVFDRNQLAGLEALTAFYLYAEPGILFSPAIPAPTKAFLGWLVRCLIENSEITGIGIARVEDYWGLDMEAGVSGAAAFGFGDPEETFFGVGANAGSSAHGGVLITNKPLDGERTGAIYGFSETNWNLGFQLGLPNTASTQFMIPLVFSSGGEYPPSYETGCTFSSTTKDGEWLSTTLETSIASTYPLTGEIDIPGQKVEYSFVLSTEDIDVHNAFVMSTPLASAIGNVGYGPIAANIENSTFRQGIVSFLERVYDDAPSYDYDAVAYRIEGAGINEFTLDLGVELPIPAAPALYVEIGGGVSGSVETSYTVGEGFWQQGVPILSYELREAPESIVSLNDVINELWQQFVTGDALGELVDIIVDAIRDTIFGWLDKSSSEFVLSDNGSSIVLMEEAIPAGVDSTRCRNWRWGEGDTPNKSMSREKWDQIRAYNQMLRAVSEEIAGMRYGIGEFYKFEPEDTQLLQPATLTICYADSEVVDLDESTLSVYYQDSTGTWIPVPSTAIPDSNKVRADITAFHAYTLGPRMPQGQYTFTSSMPDLVADGVMTTTLTSDPLLHNDGAAVEDGTLFTVAATDGAILTADADTTLAGVQVPVAGQVVQLDYQAGLLPIEVTISAVSVNGFARCETTLQLQDAGLPAAPTITSITPHWRGFTVEWDSGGDADVAGYLIWFDTDGPGAPYDGEATVWGQDSPVSVGVLDSLVVDELTPGTTYYVSITALDMEGNQSAYAEEFSVAVSGVDSQDLPRAVGLDQNFPNPFNPRTKIRYSLPRAGRVSLRIYDVRGRLVKTLVDGMVQPGRHVEVWLGDDNRGRNVASGVYLYLLQTDQETRTRKMALVR